MFRPTRTAWARGFSLLETLIALFVLTTGVIATATLAARCLSTSRQSKYITLAAELASEKLEDLSRWDAGAAEVCVPVGSTSVGSLTTDVLQTTTCPPPLSQCSATAGSSGEVSYYDDVSISTVVTGSDSPCPSTTYGCFSETVSQTQSGSRVYVTTVHPPNGQIQQLPGSSTPPTLVTFHRRWIIEGNTPVPGISAICLPGTRRVTVLVTLMDLSVQPPVTFQLSTVRP